MSNSPLPEYVDARKAFSGNALVTGVLALSELPRVAENLADSEGQVAVELAFGFDDAGRRRISGNLKAALNLPCQRCLEPNQVALDEPVDLVLVADEAEAQALNREFDPWICPDYKIRLAPLVEEQLLLGLPIVNYHNDGPCSEKSHYSTDSGHDTGQESGARADNPFAILAQLKKD